MKNLNKTKKQTAVRGRSSALIVTIVVHAVFLLIAGTYVAIEVAARQEAKFEGKQIVHPKMKLKKLRVPVKLEQKMRRQAPQISQRVTAQTVSSKSIDFKMPDMAGFGGMGTGVDLSGASLGGSIAFATTQINVFGLKSTGEKIVFLLDTSTRMIADKIGGIPAYRIIKDELTGMIGSLPSTALFNVIVFNDYKAVAFSPGMSTATDENVKRLIQWLAPLNADKTKYGFETLDGGTVVQFEPHAPIYNRQYSGWMAGLSYALQQSADTVYWMGQDEGYIAPMHAATWRACERGTPLAQLDPELSGWPKGTGAKGDYDYAPCGGIDQWKKKVAEAQKLLDKENADRLAKGQPVRVMDTSSSPLEFALVKAYFPGDPLPAWKQTSEGEAAHVYTADDFGKYIASMREQYSKKDRRAALLGVKDKELSFNVVHFVPVNESPQTLEILEPVSRRMNGKYIRIQGLKEIESASATRKK